METIESRIQKVQKQAQTGGDKQAGVRDDCNVRTDKWALAMSAMDRVNNYKLNEYLKKGEAETPKETKDQTEGGATEPNPTRDN